MKLEKNYHKDHPIIVGLAGKAATGKTSVAEGIVPKGSINSPIRNGIFWDHIFFALPIYELASIRKNILGARQADRQLFAIHETVYDIFGKTALGSIPSYDDFTKLVKDIMDLPVDSANYKPRSFLQKAGDLCRQYDPECFAKWGILKATRLFFQYTRTELYEESEMPMAVIISDVRFKSEADSILKQPNGIIICYETSDEIRNERMMKRDGHLMTTDQKNHQSEQQMEYIKSVSSAIIDSSTLTVEEQTEKTLDIISQYTKAYA